MKPFVRAGIDIEAIVWLVVVFLYALIQFVSKAAKNKPKPRRTTPPVQKAPEPDTAPAQDSSMEKQLRDFLGELAGFPQPQPSEPPPLPGKTAPDHRVPDRTPYGPLSWQEPEPMPPPAPPPAPSRSIASDKRYPAATMHLPDMQDIRAAIPPPEKISHYAAQKGAQYRNAYIPALRMGMTGFRGSSGPTRAVRPSWRNPKTFRDAMIGHIVLSPPRALQQQPDNAFR